MPFFTYILQSEKTGRLYIGQTADLANRIQQHNNGLSRSTKGHLPWRLLHFIAFDSRQDALNLERKLKKWKNKTRVLQWIQRLKDEQRTS